MFCGLKLRLWKYFLRGDRDRGTCHSNSEEKTQLSRVDSCTTPSLFLEGSTAYNYDKIPLWGQKEPVWLLKPYG